MEVFGCLGFPLAFILYNYLLRNECHGNGYPWIYCLLHV